MCRWVVDRFKCGHESSPLLKKCAAGTATKACLFQMRDGVQKRQLYELCLNCKQVEAARREVSKQAEAARREERAVKAKK